MLVAADQFGADNNYSVIRLARWDQVDSSYFFYVPPEQLLSGWMWLVVVQPELGRFAFCGIRMDWRSTQAQ
jgi:hypothetical protein